MLEFRRENIMINFDQPEHGLRNLTENAIIELRVKKGPVVPIKFESGRIIETKQRELEQFLQSHGIYFECQQLLPPNEDQIPINNLLQLFPELNRCSRCSDDFWSCFEDLYFDLLHQKQQGCFLANILAYHDECHIAKVYESESEMMEPSSKQKSNQWLKDQIRLNLTASDGTVYFFRWPRVYFYPEGYRLLKQYPMTVLHHKNFLKFEFTMPLS